MLTMYKQITIKTLDKQGVKKSQIAKELDCHRNTVTNILQREQLIATQIRVKPSVFDTYKQTIKEWLDSKISRLRIHELLQENFGFSGSYDNLCKYIQKQFPKRIEAYGVQVTSPGEVAEIDFGYLGMLPGTSGKLVKTYGIAIVLAYSRLDYYAICYDQKVETLCRELTNAFDYFGGVPNRLKVDNMKTAVLQNLHYDLTLNPDFLEFANHYSTVIIPCTPYSPQQKGTVEASIKYIQNNFISGRTFQDGADLKRQLKDWTHNYANLRIHGTTRKVPKEVFLLEEKATLQPLPQEEFAFFNRGVRKVAINCHIHFANNYYSVPAILVGKEVTIRWNDNLVRVIYQGEQVALHQKIQENNGNGSSSIGNYVTQRCHLPSYKHYSQTEYQSLNEAKMIEIGEYAHQYFTMLITTKQSYWFRIVRIILGLAQEYGSEAVNLSLKRAQYYSTTDIVIIKNILTKKLYLLEPEPLMRQQSNDTDDQVGSRDLRYYEGRVSQEGISG